MNFCHFQPPKFVLTCYSSPCELIQAPNPGSPDTSQAGWTGYAGPLALRSSAFGLSGVSSLDCCSEGRKEGSSETRIPFLLLTPQEVNLKAAGRGARDFLLRCVGDDFGSPQPVRGARERKAASELPSFPDGPCSSYSCLGSKIFSEP